MSRFCLVIVLIAARPQLAELWNCLLSRKAWAEDEARYIAPGENVQRGLKVRVELMITHLFSQEISSHWHVTLRCFVMHMVASGGSGECWLQAVAELTSKSQSHSRRPLHSSSCRMCKQVSLQWICFTCLSQRVLHFDFLFFFNTVVTFCSSKTKGFCFLWIA